MPSYSHSYVTITHESSQCEIAYIGGTDKNYAKTNLPVQTLTTVLMAGVDITPSSAKENVSGIGNVVTFGSPSILRGMVVITYVSTTGITVTKEVQTIQRYNVGGTKDNFITLKNYPIKTGSVTITDGAGGNQTSFLASYTGNGKETLKVGALPPGKYLVTYDYDNGEAGKLWKENYTLNQEITDNQAFIAETNTKYQDALTDATNEIATARKNYRLWLMRQILLLLPVTTNEATYLGDVQNYWAANGTLAMDDTELTNLKNYVQTLKDQMDANGTPTSALLLHTKYNSKIYTFLAQLAELDNAVETYAFSAGTKYDYDGLSNSGSLSGGERDYFTDGTLTAAGSYSKTTDYALRLVLTDPLYIIGIELTVVPSDNTGLNLDQIDFHLATSTSLTPSNFIDSSGIDKQESNTGFKNIVSQEVNKYAIFKYINELLKDSTGAPIDKDANNNKFDHRVLMKRGAVYIFKKSQMTNNYIAELKLYTPNQDIIDIQEYLNSDDSANDRVRVYNKTVEFLNLFNSGGNRVYAWRGSNSDGVTTAGGLGSPADGLSYFDATHFGGVGSQDLPWAYVYTDINTVIGTDFGIDTTIAAIISAWSSELTTESISTDQKTIDNSLTIWKKKYETAQQKYVSARNAKTTKTIELIQKQQVLTVYGTLPTIP